MKKNPIHQKIMLQALRQAGFKCRKVDKLSTLYLIEKNKRKAFFNGTLRHDVSHLSYAIAKSKELSNDVFQKFGLPVPKRKICLSFNDALDFFKKHKPVVIKPDDRSLGVGVSVNISSQEDLKTAYEKARKASKCVAVEEFVRGRDYRLTVVNYQKVYAIERVPAHIVGNGQNSVQELIDIKNGNKRGYQKDIKIDNESLKILRQQELNLTFVPELGQIVYLRQAANVAQGGTTIEIGRAHV